jgi:hypothetical protein
MYRHRRDRIMVEEKYLSDGLSGSGANDVDS